MAIFSSTISATPRAAVGRIEIERRADIGSQRASGRRGIQQHRAAGKAGRVDPAERDIGVGDGRAGAAPVVAGRAGVRSRAARADGDPAETVHAAQGAAAGADLDHLHHRDAQGQAAAALEAVGAVDLEIPRRLGRPSSIRQIFAVVPPMSKETALAAPVCRATAAA